MTTEPPENALPDDGLSPAHVAMASLHETYLILRDVGFSETEALKFVAFCSIYDGDLSDVTLSDGTD